MRMVRFIEKYTKKTNLFTHKHVSLKQNSQIFSRHLFLFLLTPEPFLFENPNVFVTFYLHFVLISY